MSYNQYTISDFVLDDSFLSYVLCTDPEAVAFWTNWLAQNPHREEEVQKAAELIRLLNGPKPTQVNSDREAQLRRLIEQLPSDRMADPVLLLPSRRSHTYRRLGVNLAAATVALMLLAGIGWYLSQSFLQSDQIIVQTTYGQKTTRILPDGSRVMLNANTTLRYTPVWQEGTEREVWLEGEAFFNVMKQKTSDKPVKFTVHAGKLAVEVLGTQFNVKNRTTRTHIVLEEGKVRLRSNVSSQPLLDMTPGEAAVYSQKDQLLSRQSVDPKLFNSWRRNRLVFDNTPLSEVAETIRDTYGKTVIFEDSELMNRRLTGTIPDDDLTRLSQALSRAFNLHITIRNDKMLVQSW